MPIVNSMSATGIVSLPGMMTGQILGGVSPGDAVKYQILIMFLIAGGTGIGAVAAVLGCALPPDRQSPPPAARPAGARQEINLPSVWQVRSVGMCLCAFDLTANSRNVGCGDREAVFPQFCG